METSTYTREEDGFRCDRCGYFYPFDRTDGTPPEQCENCLDGAPPPLEEQFAADIKDLIDSGAGMPFVFNPGEAFMLLAVLQLALRHPGLDGAAGAFARELAKNIEDRLCVKPMRKDIARTPECNCLNCGTTLNSIGTCDPNVAAGVPEPGDVTVCIRCGAVMKLDDNLLVRGMSDAEMDELIADKEGMDELARVVKRVHFVRHMQG